MVLKPKKKLKRKLKLRSKTKIIYPSWSNEEVESFIYHSYRGKFHSVNDRWKNFPLKPEMRHKEVIDSIDRLREVVREWKQVPAFAFDTETNTLEVLGENKNFRLVDITVSWGDGNNYEIPLGHLRDEDLERNLDLEEVVELIKPIFENPNVLIVGHNLKYDLHVLRRVGITVTTDSLFDTMLASWICDENTPNGLKENSAEKMGVPQTHFKEVTDSIPNDVKKAFGYKANSKVHDFGLVLIDDGSDYCIGDAFYTWCNFLGFRQEIVDEEMDKIYYVKMIPFLKVLLEMEEQGTTVDIERLKQMGVEMEQDIENLQYKIYELAGCIFNIGSSAQKSLILFGIDDYTMPFEEYLEKYKKKNAKRLSKSKTGLDVKKVRESYDEKQKDPDRLCILSNSFDFKVMSYTASGAPSTDSDTIWRLSQLKTKNRRKQEGIEMCKSILEYSKLSKLKTAFVDGILEQLYEDGKAHPSFNQIGCVEGNTLIPTIQGLIPIKNLSSDFKDGVRLPLKTQIVNRYCEFESTSHIVQFKDENTKVIETALGIKLECSNIHPVITNCYTSREYYNNSFGCRKSFYLDSSKTWCKAEDLTTDKYLYVPIGYHSFSETNPYFEVKDVVLQTNAKKAIIPNTMSDSLAEFLGIYYADGSIHDNNGSFSIIITNTNEDVHKRVLELSLELFGVVATVSKDKSEVSITAKSLSQIETLYEMKRGCVNKVIPNCILKSTEECIKAFLRGVTLDSCVIQEDNKKAYLKITVSNYISASYIQSILFNIGIISSVRQDVSKTENVYLVTIYNEQYEKFRDEIGFVESEKDIIISYIGTSNHNYLKSDDKGIWVKVRRVLDSFNPVYHFSVPNTHSFISGSFISHNTDSGRISCSRPNLQQLPKAEEDDKYQIRSVFIGSLYAVNKFSGALFDVTPEEAKKLNKKDFEVKRKKIIAIDYHNLEMVCLTHFSHDKNLTEMFANDDDAHGSTAVNMFELDCTPTECKKKYPHLRQAAKTLNFLLMYGGGAQLLYENLKGDHYSPVDLGSKEYLEQYNCRSGKEVAQKYIDKYFDSYSGVAKFISGQKKFAHKYGYVRTVLGRKRRLPDINSRDMAKSSYCERLSVNSAIQGTAGDITISAQLRVASEERLKEMLCYMLIQIHDEIVLEVPEEYAEEAVKIIKHDMEYPFGDNSRNIDFLRADYDIADNYQEAK